MSIDAIHIAKRAVLPLLTELLATGEQENRIALGELYSGDEYIQVQLLAELNQGDGLRREDLVVTRSAVLLLAMYGVLALASREANADRDNEEALA